MPNPTRDALIIAITEYGYLPMPPEMTQLSAGAEQIAQRLETQGDFRVTRLPATKQGDKTVIDPQQLVTADNSSPNIQALKPAIEQLLLPKSDRPPTTALIYFAGHGLRKEHKNGNTEGFLATSEADPQDNQWGISLTWLRELLDKSPIKQQIVWIDACHSGELIHSTPQQHRRDAMLASPLLASLERCFIASARPHEDAYAEGLLTKALLETLDYTQQLNPWVDHLTLIENLEAKNKTAAGAQRFLFEKTDKPILLTNKAFDLEADYKNICPFKGLESFDFEKNPDDPLYFKGRTELTEELLEKVQTANFLAVLGASGNGKSSVVRAGLLYKLQQTQPWRILPVITPTADPFKALGTLIGMPAEQLSDFIKQAQTERLVLVIDQFEEIFTLCKNDAQREQFFELLLTAVEQTDNPFSLIIVMRADFLDKCSHHVELAKKIQAHQVIVTPMTAAELEEAIVAPIQQVGLQIEPKLVSEMLADVKGALGSLPLLQYTLKELWKTCATQRLLTYSAYEKLGKIAGTLEQGANSVYQKLSPAEQKTAQRIFIELTQLGEGSPDTRRQLSQQDLVTSLPFESAPVNQVIQKLVAANLVVTDKPKAEQVAIVNIAHEALIQHWGQLGGWLDGNRDAIKIQRDIEADAKKFQDSNQSKSALLQGLNLNIAKDYAKTHTEKVPLSILALDFVKRSVKRQRDLKWSIRTIVAVVILVLLGAAYYSYVQWTVADEQRVEAENQRQFAQTQQQLADEQRIEADNQRRFAQTQQQLADERRIEAETQRQFAQTQQKLAEDESQRANQEKDNVLRSESLLLSELSKQEMEKSNATKGMLLALDALPQDISNPNRPYVPEAEEALYNNVILPHTSLVLKHDSMVEHAEFSSDGKYILTLSADSDRTKAYLWERISGKLVYNGTFDTNYIHFNEEYITNHANFSYDVQRIITTSDKTAIIWDTKTRQKINVLRGHKNELNSAVFSPDNNKLVLTASKKTVRLWNADTGKQISLWKGDKALFAPDGKMIATEYQGTVRLWDVNTGQQISILRNVGNLATFSPTGQFIVTQAEAEAEDDNISRIWNIKTRKKMASIEGYNVTFSPNEEWVVTISHHDEAAILWEITGQQKYVLEGHETQGNTVVEPRVKSAVFSSDGTFIVTAGSDKTARLWSTKTGEQLVILGGHKSSINYVTFDSSGKYLVTASGDKWPGGNWMSSEFLLEFKERKDNTARVWNIATSKKVKFFCHDLYASNVVFSPNSQLMACLSKFGYLELWDVNSNKKLTEREFISDHYHKLDNYHIFFIDNQRIAIELDSRDFYDTVWLYDIKTDQSTVIDFDSGQRQCIAVVGQHFITVDYETGIVNLLDINNNLKIATFTNEKANCDNVFNYKNKYLVFFLDNIAHLWDIESKKQSHVLSGHHKDITDVEFSPDGQYVITTSKDHTARLWDVSSGKQLYLFSIQDKDSESSEDSEYINYYDAIFSADGQRVATTNTHTVFVWDVKTGKQIARLEHETNTNDNEFWAHAIHAAFTSPDGERMLTSLISEPVVRLWDVNTSNQLAVFKSFFPTLSPNYEYFAIQPSLFEPIRVLPLFHSTQALINHARKNLPQEVSLE